MRIQWASSGIRKSAGYDQPAGCGAAVPASTSENMSSYAGVYFPAGDCGRSHPCEPRGTVKPVASLETVCGVVEVLGNTYRNARPSSKTRTSRSTGWPDGDWKWRMRLVAVLLMERRLPNGMEYATVNGRGVDADVRCSAVNAASWRVRPSGDQPSSSVAGGASRRAGREGPPAPARGAPT